MATPTVRFLTTLRQRLESELEMDKNDLDRELNAWKEGKGDSLRTQADFYWACLNQALKHYSQNFKTEMELYENQRKVYLLMFEFLIEEDRSRSHITEALNLLDIKKAGLHNFEVEVEIIGTRDCTHGRSVDGLKVSYETALNNFPLDYSKCDRNGGCICNVGFEGKRDAGGKLMIKNP
jgi:hypothetical protein